MALHVIRLEDRILFDAAAVAVIADAAQNHNTADTAEHSAESAAADHQVSEVVPTAAPDAPPSPSGQPVNVLLVSSNIDNAEQLAAAVAEDVLVVVYDAKTSTLDSLFNELNDLLGGKKADSIGFVTHGQNGQFELTQSTYVNSATLEASADLNHFWSNVGSLMQEGGRVDLLGCNLGGTDYGLLNSLNQALDASGNDIDIAASTDITGNNPGQNWILEVGNIDAGLYFNQTNLLSWSGDLAQILVTNTNDSGAGSLRAAILEANATPGLDTITFGDLDVSSDQTITLLSDLPWINDAVTIDATTALNYEFGIHMITLINTDDIILNSTGVTIKGLDIRNNIRIDGGANTLESNRLASVTSQGSSGYQTIENNIISGTIATNGLGANISDNLIGVDANNANINAGSGIQIRGTGASIVSGNTLGYEAGISVASDAHTLVENNYIGVTASGVNIGTRYAMTIGSDATLSGNTIGYANEVGLAIYGGNITLGANSIGTDSTGTANYQGYQALVVYSSNSMVFDGDAGFKVRGAIFLNGGSHTITNMDLSHASINASSGYQTITNNVMGGVINMYGAAGATITGNRVGVDENDANINAGGGIQVAGSEDSIVSENILGYGAGISVASAGYTTIENNYIGVTADGVNIAGLTWTGMTISSDATLEGNTIGNIWEQGLVINGGDITLGANSIGTDSTGTANYAIYQALYINTSNSMMFDGDAGLKVRGGIVITAGSHTITNMDLSYSSITSNASSGYQTITNNVVGGAITTNGAGANITGNLVGVNANNANINVGSAIYVRGSEDSIVSGNTLGFGASISVVSDAHTMVENNFIGVNAEGLNIAGTTWTGISTSTDATLSGNTIRNIHEQSVYINGGTINLIGNDIQNSYIGVYIAGSPTVSIGGVGLNEGNIIANNGTAIYIPSTTAAVSIRGNSMYSNSTTVYSDVPNPPTITFDAPFTKDAASLSLSGLLTDGNGSDNWIVDFYANPAGENGARYYLGSATVDLAVSNAFNFSYNGVTTAFKNIVAMATDLGAQNTFGLSTPKDLNQAPVASANATFGSEDATYTFSASDFVFSDADGDPLSVRILSLPSNGTLLLDGAALSVDAVFAASDIADGKLTFVPNLNFNGNINFNFLVTDGSLNSNSTTMTLNLAPVSDAPTAGGNTLSLPPSGPLVFATSNFAFSDVDGDAFHSIRITSLPVIGMLTLDGVNVQVNDVISAADIAAGKLSYIGTGADANFGYQVSDGTLSSNIASLNIVGVYTIQVTNLLNTGLGSLRQAIIDSNARAGLERIVFNLDVNTLQTINITAALPTITGPVIIDGTSATGYLFGSNMVQIRGPASTFAGFTFAATASGSTLQGLNIINMGTSTTARAISVTGGNDYVFDSNVIGLDLNGTASRNYAGVYFQTTGSGSVVSNSIISGNLTYGIYASSQSALTIQNNNVGLDIAGNAARSNGSYGVFLSGGNLNVVKDNVVSGNSYGIYASSQTNLVVQNNRTGTNAAGTAAVANSIAGIYLTSGSVNTGNIIQDNLVSGNSTYGIYVSSQGGITVQNNLIGMEVTGTSVIKNGSYGLFVSSVNDSTFKGNTVIGNGTATTYEAYFSNSDRNIIQGNQFGYPLLQSAGTSLRFEATSNNNTVGSATNTAEKNIINDAFVTAYSDLGGNGDILNQNIFYSQLGNLAPVTSPKGLVVTTDIPVAFQISDFGYLDPNNDPLHSITVTSLPVNGELLLDGASVSIGQEILAADIASGKLTYLLNGFGKFSFNYTVSDGELSSAPAQFNLSNPTPILVTNLNDSGAGSLRQAITDANASAGFDIINFSLELLSSARTINLLTILPTITESVLIDATTAGGYDFGTNMVTLFGNYTSVTANAFKIQTDGVTVRGFDILRFWDPAIYVVSGSNHLFENNIIGLDLDENVSANWYGFSLNGGGSGTIIRDNVISGNQNYGIYAPSQNALTIQGNLIGTDRLGMLDKGNTSYGVYISGGSGHKVIDNVISGNNSYGVFLSSVSNTTVQANKIGVGLDGVTRIANSNYGLYASSVTGSLFGGYAPTEGNIIAGNTSREAYFSGGNSNTIQGNQFGDPDTQAAANSLYLENAGASTVVGSSDPGYKNWINDAAGKVGIVNNGTGPTILGGGNVFFSNPPLASSAPPVNEVPGAQTIGEDQALALGNLISISEPASDTAELEVVLTASNGTLSFAETAGVAANGNGTGEVSLSGMKADIAALLSTLFFNPFADFSGEASITMQTTGVGGATQILSPLMLQSALADNTPKVDTDVINITVEAQNDAPVITAPDQAFTNEDTALNFGSLISVNDVDMGSGSGFMIFTVNHGTLTLGDTSGLLAQNNVNGVITIQGTLAALNNALVGLTFNPDADFNGNAQLTIEINDQGNSGAGGPLTDSQVAVINILAINDAPLLTTPGDQVIAEDTSLNFGNFISLTDVDMGSARVTLQSSHGTLTLGNANNISVSEVDGVLTLEGTIADLNLSLNGLTFNPDANFNGEAGLNITVNDLGNGGGDAISVSESILINVTAVNDGPEVTVLPDMQVNEDASITFGSAITFSDVDIGSGTATVILNATSGTLTLGNISNLAELSGNGTNMLTLRGDLLALNHAMNLLEFTPDANFNGFVNLNIQISDEGFTGAGNALSSSSDIALMVNPVNDAPVNSNPAGQIINLDQILTFGQSFGNAFVVSDIDAGNNPVWITLDAAGGLLSLGNTHGLTFLNGDGAHDAFMRFSGLLNDVNAALEGLTFIASTDGYNGSASLTWNSSDGEHSDTTVVAIDVTAIAGDYVVRSAADSGFLSLRHIINITNITQGSDRILFADSLGNNPFINLESLLPQLMGDVAIEGTRANDVFGSAMVTINANGLSSGLILGGSGGNRVEGLHIANASGQGVDITSNGNVVEANWISDNRNGIRLTGANNTLENNMIGNNRESGVELNNAINAAIHANIVSGNTLYGLLDKGSLGSHIEANHFIANQNINIVLDSTLNAFVKNNVLTDSGVGLMLFNADNSQILSNAATGNEFGMVLNLSNSNQLSNNVLSDNATAGLLVTASSGNAFLANKIGLNAAGDEGLGNGEAGIVLNNAQNNAFNLNLIDANDTGVIMINSSGNVFDSNKIGEDFGGRFGFVADTSSGNTLNNNLIVNQSEAGLLFTNSSQMQVTNNMISDNDAGAIFSGSNSINFTGNKVMNHAAEGALFLNSSNGVVRNNVFDSNDSGIVFKSGSNGNLFEGNIVSENRNGLIIQNAKNTLVQNNKIGTDAAGLEAMGNGFGVVVDAGNNTTLLNNLIADNVIGVVAKDSSGFIMKGNRVGTDATGNEALGNSFGVLLQNADGAVIGATGQGNVISGNEMFGLVLYQTDNASIVGNNIGVNAAGNAEVSNGDTGVLVELSNGNTFQNNVIAGNMADGLVLKNSSNNTLTGNFFGTNRAATLRLENAFNNILITGNSDNNKIGTLTGGNTIAFSPNSGVLISGTAADGNSILSNTYIGNLGLDVESVDDGNNSQDNADKIEAKFTKKGLEIKLDMDKDMGKNLLIQFYGSTFDPVTGAEVKVLIATQQVDNTKGKDLSFTYNNVSLPAGIKAVSALVTNLATGDTSEFGDRDATAKSKTFINEPHISSTRIVNGVLNIDGMLVGKQAGNVVITFYAYTEKGGNAIKLGQMTVNLTKPTHFEYNYTGTLPAGIKYVTAMASSVKTGVDTDMSKFTKVQVSRGYGRNNCYDNDNNHRKNRVVTYTDSSIDLMNLTTFTPAVLDYTASNIQSDISYQDVVNMTNEATSFYMQNGQIVYQHQMSTLGYDAALKALSDVYHY